MAKRGQGPRAEFVAVEETALYEPQDLAIILNRDKRTVYRLLREGRLPGAKLGGSWYTKGADLLAYYEEQKARAAKRREDARSSG